MKQKKFKDIPKKLRTYVTEGFRKAFKYSHLYKDCLGIARKEQKTYKKDGNLSKKLSVWYHCADCKALFKKPSINVDHVEPVVPIESTLEDMTFSEYFTRLFSSNLQVLCKPCHHRKTADEKKLRTKGPKK